jgi:EAL domain-containing protein (putative c-di-GMP-specific phosphodiesterase class I)/GGDEF domain-containing protein
MQSNDTEREVQLAEGVAGDAPAHPAAAQSSPRAEARGSAEAERDPPALSPLFQPVVDILTGETLGYEAFIRGRGEVAAPEALFGRALQAGTAAELDEACRSTILRAIQELPEGGRPLFFLNTLLLSVGEAAMPQRLGAMLDAAGLDHRRVVLDLPEPRNTAERALFRSAAKRCADVDLTVCMDDFGTGCCAITDLLRTAPTYVKLDESIVRRIDRDAANQRLVQSLASFTEQAGIHLVAEAVQTKNELQALRRLGVRYAQGNHLWAPVQTLEPGISRTLQAKLAPRPGGVCTLREAPPVGQMAVMPPVHSPGTLTCEGLDTLFREDHSLDHVLVGDGRGEHRMVTRQHFYTLAGGPFGYSLYQRKFVEEVAKGGVLAICECSDLVRAGRLAMNRRREDLYDPVIVKTSEGGLVGTVTMKQLLSGSIDLEVSRAQGANPLTNLPGNHMIQEWIAAALENPPYTVIYGDLDAFKEYNDSYGFASGDEMIRTASRVLADYVPEMGTDARLGHVGGDDFVVVVNGTVEDEVLSGICTTFDRRKAHLFEAADLQRGYYEVPDRRGNPYKAPLVTLSLSVLSDENLGPVAHPAQFGRLAAGLKKKIKRMTAESGRSGFLRERRQEPSADACQPPAAE